MDLAELRFKVDTTELEKADKAIGQLAASVGKLNKVSDDAAKMAAKLEAADAKKAKELAKVAVETEKVNQAKARTAKVEAEAAAATEKSALAAAKTAAESAKAEAAILRVEKAKKAEAETTSKAVSIQERQNSILEFMQQGYTRGQSSILAYAKAAGEATGEIAKILDLQRQLIGGDPFDKSLSGVKALKNELAILTEVQNLYNQGAELTTKQVRELARDEERLLQVMKQRGATDDQIEQATKDLKREYMQLAGQVNAVVDQEKAMIKAQREAAAGAKYMADTDARLAAALDQTNQSLDRRSTDTMVKYRAALIATGASSDQVATKMANLKNQLDAVAAKEREQQLRYLARAISVQMGDVAISLASGMNPLLVMIQQGDQIRGAIEQTGAKGQELTKAMSEGAATIARSFRDTAVAVGSFFGGAIKSAGQTVLDLAIGPTKVAIAAFSDLANGTKLVDLELQKLKDAGLAGLKLGLIGLVATLGILGVEYLKIMKAETELSRALTNTGAALGLTKAEAIEYAQSFTQVSGTSYKAMQVITEMARVSNLGRDAIAMVMQSAIDLERYGGVAIADTVKQFSKIADDPVKALLEVAKANGSVDVEIIKTVKSLQDQGEQAAAVALAMYALSEANKRTAEMQKNSLSPIEKLWIDIKGNIDSARQAIFNLAKSEAIVDVFRKTWQVISVVVSEVWYVLKQIGVTLGGVMAIVANPTQAGTIFAQMKQDAQNARFEHDKYIQSLLGINKVDNQVTQAIIDNDKKEMQSRATNAAAARKLEEELKKSGKGTKGDTPTSDNRRTASGVLPTPRTNEVEELKKRFDDQLALARDFNKSERDILKARFDAGLIERGEFIVKDTALLRESEKQQLALIKEFELQYMQGYGARVDALVEARDKQIAANKGLKDETKANAEVQNRFETELARLGNTAETVYAQFENMRRGIANAVTTREIQRIIDFDKAILAGKKSYIDYTNALKDANTERQLEAQLQDSLVGASEASAVRLKAEFDTLKRLAPELRKFSDTLILAEIALRNVETDPNAGSAEREAALKYYREAYANVQNSIKDSRIAAEKAGTDAITAYYKQEMLRISNSISDAIVTALFEGGKAGSKKIRDVIIAELKKPITVMIQAVVNPIMNQLFGAFGFGTGGSAAGPGSSFSIGDIGSTVSGAKGLSEVATLGYTSAITSQMNKVIFSDVGKLLGLSSGPGYLNAATTAGAGGTGGLNAATSSTGGLNAAASSTSGITATASGTTSASQITKLGSTVQNVGVALVTGYISNKIRAGIAGGYKLSGAGETLLDIGNIAASFFGPIAQLVTGAISGLVSRAFGRKLTEVGVMGTFGGAEGFQGQQYTMQKGGWFRSDKMGVSNLDPEVSRGLAAQFNTIRASMLTMAAGLGVGSDAILNFTKDIKVNLKGLSEEDALKALEKAFLDTQEELAGVVLGTDMYSAANESNLDTLNRLHRVLGTVNSTFDNLGFQLYDLSLANADAAQSFVDLFGGIEKFQEATNKYYENFYTQEEKLSNLLRQMSTSFELLGLQLPQSIQGFRQIADAAKAAGDDATFAAILKLQDPFLQMIQMIEGFVDDAAKSAAGSYAEYQMIKAEMIAAKLPTPGTSGTATITSVPEYATGGSYSGGLALVGETGPELINFSQPGYIYDSAETATILSSGNTSLVSELQGLRYEVSLLRAEVRADVSHNAKTARLLDRVIPDGDSIQIVTAPA